LLSVPACWHWRLGEDYEPFRAAFLSKNSQPAKYYPCPRSCGCMHEIIETPNTKLQAPEKHQVPSSKSPMPLSDSELGAWCLELNNPSHLLAVCRCEPPHCPDIPLTPADA